MAILMSFAHDLSTLVVVAGSMVKPTRGCQGSGKMIEGQNFHVAWSGTHRQHARGIASLLILVIVTVIRMIIMTVKTKVLTKHNSTKYHILYSPYLHLIRLVVQSAGVVCI